LQAERQAAAAVGTAGTHPSHINSDKSARFGTVQRAERQVIPAPDALWSQEQHTIIELQLVVQSPSMGWAYRSNRHMVGGAALELKVLRRRGAGARRWIRSFLLQKMDAADGSGASLSSTSHLHSTQQPSAAPVTPRGRMQLWARGVQGRALTKEGPRRQI
jgi:hypothetical protein